MVCLYTSIVSYFPYGLFVHLNCRLISALWLVCTHVLFLISLMVCLYTWIVVYDLPYGLSVNMHCFLSPLWLAVNMHCFLSPLWFVCTSALFIIFFMVCLYTWIVYYFPYDLSVHLHCFLSSLLFVCTSALFIIFLMVCLYTCVVYYLPYDLSVHLNWCL